MTSNTLITLILGLFLLTTLALSTYFLFLIKNLKASVQIHGLTRAQLKNFSSLPRDIQNQIKTVRKWIYIFLASIFFWGIVTAILLKDIPRGPRGWELPNDDALLSQEWRNQSPTLFVNVDGDFNGDGQQDRAMLMINAEQKKCGAFVWWDYDLSKPPAEVWQEDLALLEVTGLDIEKAKTGHKRACAEGLYSCDSKTPNSKGDNLVIFTHLRGATSMTWNESTRSFTPTRISE